MFPLLVSRVAGRAGLTLDSRSLPPTTIWGEREI